jgi:serine/threonine-protein kinase
MEPDENRGENVESRGDKQDAEITQIGKYDIIDVLGRGGMGVVYRGIDKQIGREVAIKTLTEGYMRDPGMLARFYEEARRTGRLKHPNIVTVYDLGDDHGTPYIVMECIEGEPLDKMIRSGASLSMADRLGIMEEVCSALGYAHRNHVIHRDVKPANIFVQPDGTAKLLDFGIARLEKRDQDQSMTRTGNIIGTVPYMAPERLLNQTVDGRSDIFATGVVLFQLLTGEMPFTGEDTALMQKILNEPHPSLSSIDKKLPASLEMIVDRALAKNPDDRYSTAEEMASDLTAAIAELQNEQIGELVTEARRLVDETEFTRARSVLHRVLRIDSKHGEARRLLGEIQAHLTQRQRDERVQQIRRQAEDAIAGNQFDQGLLAVESGLELDAANPELMKLQAKARKEKERQNRLNELQRQVDSARRKGDLKGAIQAAEEARKADQTNPRIVALCNSLAKEAELAQKHAQAKVLLGSARGEINFRRYSEAIDLLKQVEQLDPTNPEIPLLRKDANSGMEQARRREAIAQLEEEVATASTLEQLQKAARSIKDAMASLPSEAALFRLNAQVDRQIKEQENRQAVEELIQACRDLEPREALDLVRKARQRMPEEERLISLEALLADRFRLQAVEERQGDYLSRARDALKGGRYADAVRILEACQAEGIAAGETLSLLEFARNEEAAHRRQSELRTNLAHAQMLIADEAFEEAIEFLEGAIRQRDDAALHLLLDQASSGRASLHRQIEAALSSARNLLQDGQLPEAIQLLAMQAPAVQRAPRVRMALAALEEERQQALFRFVGRSYTALETDIPAGDAVMRCVEAVTSESTVFVAMASAFRSREQSFADRIIAEVTRRAKALLREKNKEDAGQALQSVAGLVDYGTAPLKTDWLRTREKVVKNGLGSRLRK